jgi:hypothetical protein
MFFDSACPAKNIYLLKLDVSLSSERKDEERKTLPQEVLIENFETFNLIFSNQLFILSTKAYLKLVCLISTYKTFYQFLAMSIIVVNFFINDIQFGNKTIFIYLQTYFEDILAPSGI